MAFIDSVYSLVFIVFFCDTYMELTKGEYYGFNSISIYN